MKLNSIRFRATVLYTGILLAILVIYSVSVFLIVRHTLYRDLDDDLKVKAKEIADILNAYEEIDENQEEPIIYVSKNKVFLGKQQLLYEEKKAIDNIWRAQAEALNLKSDYINILNVVGKSVIKSESLTDELKELFFTQFPFNRWNVLFKDIGNSRYKLRVINYPFSYKTGSQYVVQVATSLVPMHRLLNQILILIAGSAFLILFMTSFLGRFLTERILQPVKEVAVTANVISHKDFSRRIEEKELDDEMKYLISSFNSMIDRLEKSFKHINEFSSFVAHELKTPLAVIRGELELVLSGDHSASEYKQAMQVSIEEIDRLIKIIKELLLLAQLDYKPDVLKFENIDLMGLLQEVYDHAKILSESKQISVDFVKTVDNVYVSADRLHLRRLFLNLVHNALKFTPAHGRIIIRTDIKDDTALVEVTDTGEGIPPQYVNKIFEKFFKIPQINPQDEQGVGLGLSIAQSIAHAHHGSIEVCSELHQGSTFTVKLPRIT